ncbi:long-chain fatty acid--CoA ligase [Gulosibacter macacae]|uniref:Long-chain fatty acid--CoA ligase n=1 Tax=Gulosibacter macacae TaxID=2488791 RepID=A0A3P3VW18_9MICO|nr:AMP-dependent synthetase/ligase [Gulosibacter macacae]RRJ85816.1 long-chain fatty acid--CoA ligase [Gulosibacter macacae]
MSPRLRETTTPPSAKLSAEQSLNSMLRERLERDPESVFAEERRGGDFAPITMRTLADDVLATAKGFIALGISPGDTVGIMAATRYEWTVLDFAVLAVGGVVVPIYHTSSQEQVEWMVTDSAIRILVVENGDHAALTEPLLESTGLERVLRLDEDALGALREAGREIADDEVAARRDAVRFDDLATICYTSGTTGRPKGVELTHGNLLSHVANGVADAGLHDVVSAGTDGVQKRTLLFLPLSHSYGRFAQMLCVHSGSVLGYAPSTKQLVNELQAFRPTWLIAVPRVFETVVNSADAKAGTGMKLRLFRWAVRAAESWSVALDTEAGPSALQRWRRVVADRLVLGKIRAAMGGEVEYAISGGAALSERHGHFFRGIGVTVMEGYGATETTAPASVNRPGLIKIGTVGAPYPGTSIRIAEDGEVRIKGAGVFRGYRNNAEANASSFDEDGWYRTGDIGYLDADGYLKISGRTKEIIVTAGGKNVQPAVLEGELRSHPLIGEVLVVGEGKPFIGALIALDEAMLPTWLRNHGVGELTLEQARTHPAVRDSIQRAIDQANLKVSRAESIRKFTVVRRSFSEAEGEISASTKLIRRVVLANFSDAMTDIYGADAR